MPRSTSPKGRNTPTTDLGLVEKLLGKFPRLSRYNPEWRGASLYLVESGVKDNIAGTDDLEVARLKPRTKNADDWQLFWHDSSGRWKWEPIYAEGSLEECFAIVSRNEMGLFLG